jgi:hypothetical protein
MASKNDKVNATMQIIVSLSILFIGLLILTAPNFAFSAALSDSMQKVAAGWVGAVIGYWLN